MVLVVTSVVHLSVDDVITIVSWSAQLNKLSSDVRGLIARRTSAMDPLRSTKSHGNRVR